MKILLVNDYGYYLGGAEYYFFGLKKGLEQKGYKVFTLSSNRIVDKRTFLTEFQILESGHCFNLDSYFNIANFFQFKKILKKLDPDIVHLNNIFYSLSPSILLALKKYKTVMTLHDYYIICFRDKTLLNLDICTYPLGPICYKKDCVNKREYIRGKIKGYIIKAGLKNVDLFISPSEYLKNEFERNGISNIKVLPNFCLLDKVELPAFKDSSTLLYIGRLAKQKGIEYLIKAMPEVVKRFPEVILKIAGTGPEERSLKNLVDELQLVNNVKFLGWLDGERKDSVIRESLVLVLPSVWPEISGIVKYEAATYGKAMIASNVGGIPEFIQEGKTGFLVPPKDIKALSDKIIYILSNKKILKEIEENLVNKIKDYKLEKYINHLEKIYINLK